ncbi:ecdysone-induced protein 74EF-like [Aplysia californica]|uniref:Ecdysone-induced protein 74EF-like n=1 Tax=Aplysia californica TaxID=6500 RepID=A0ABM1AFK3_APLCA|nr:ecdysone-induced protein 74EF-like [Aplysia californica]
MRDPTKNSPSPTLTYIRDPCMTSPSPPFRPIREGLSTSPSLLTRDVGSRDSPPSPFRPIKDFVGSSPSPPYKPVRTHVSVEVHHHHHHQQQHQQQQQQHQQQQQQQQQQHGSDVISHSMNSSEELQQQQQQQQQQQHQQLSGRLDRSRSCADPALLYFRTVPLSKIKAQNRTVYSHSLESATPSRHAQYKDSRKVKSYEDFLEDHDVLKITEFSKGPFYNTDFDIISELGSPTGSKVRYNDTGSLEQLNEDQGDYLSDLDLAVGGGRESRRDQDHSEDTEDSAETINGNRKYQALWRLRATLEEEEECSDTIRMEDMTSPDDSPDRDHVTPNTTSFESNAQSDPCPSDHQDSGILFEVCSSTPRRPSQANLLHPNYENRRQSYRNVLNNRLQRGNQSTSVENSFDSVETDGEVSDTSRYEVTTTSFESTTTTDNTDSTTESQASKLRQMKADSGYKSLEAQQQMSKELQEGEGGGGGGGGGGGTTHGISSLAKEPRRENRAGVDRASVDRASVERADDVTKDVCKNCGEAMSSSSGAMVAVGAVGAASVESGFSGGYRERRNSGAGGIAQKNGGMKKPSPPSTSYFDRRNGKTASKKRREYSRERQTVHVYESMNEPETDSRSDLHSGGSFEDSSIPNKISVFARFFKSHPRGHRTHYLVRDYSIDEKTNSIFNEFVRQEFPPGSREAAGRLGVRRSPRMHRQRLQRKHTEPATLSEERSTRRDRLAPSMRSASLGSDSSASSARRISPQDSIEEEEDEVEEAMAPLPPPAPLWAPSRLAGKSPDLSYIQRQMQQVSIHDIPIIKLPEEENQDSCL